MSEYEDDELPEISVNTSADASQFSMPDADVLATQRAEEAARDKEIRELRDRAATDRTNANGILLLHGSDSSGSEGEVALAAVIDSLQVAPTAIEAAPSPADILQVLIPHVQCNNKEFLTEFLICLKEADDGVDKVADSFLDSVSHLLQCDNEWSDDEVLNVCVACVSVSVGDIQCAGRGKKVLLQILDNVASKEQVGMFTAVLVASLSSIEPSVRLRLVGATRGARGSQRAALAVGSTALTLILKADDLCGTERLTARSILPLITSTWRTLPAKDQYEAVQLLGRVLDRDSDNTEEEEAREQLLSTLAHAATNATDRNHPNTLKVLVAVSKLQLLFRNKR